MKEVRKASSIKSIAELGLDNTTELYAKRRMYRREASYLEGIILGGRIYTHDLPENGAAKAKTIKRSLENLGLLRHDFEPITFTIGGFYSVLFGHTKPNRPFTDRDNRILIVRDVYDFESNKDYESFRNVTSEEHIEILKIINGLLDETSASIIKRYFGLENAKMDTLTKIAQDYGFKTSLAVSKKNIALKILRENGNLFPKLLGSVNRMNNLTMQKSPRISTKNNEPAKAKIPSELDMQVLQKLDKIKELRAGKIFATEEVLFNELEKLSSNRNFSYSEDVQSLINLYRITKEQLNNKIDAIGELIH